MARETIVLTVNGERKEVWQDPETRLIRVLRDELGLTGTKEGCGTGHCGSCTVILNGKKVKSCAVSVAKANGGEILTIEGLGTPDNPHPIQEAFVRAGAVQCGFCTPGMVLTAKVLLDKNTRPSREEIINEFMPNLCRCTGYEPIIKAVQLAATLLAQSQPATCYGMGWVGDQMPQRNALEKATGKAVYAADLNKPGMSVVKVIRSPHAHARILSIDLAAASQIPGVEKILTARDIPGAKYLGPVVEDQPVLADGLVRFVGEPVAIVVASNEAAAVEGLRHIKVQYELLEAVLDPLVALQPDSIQVHPRGNVVFTRVLHKGDVDQAFAEADVVVTDVFTTPAQEHAYLEPESAVAEIDGDGRLVVYCGTQAAHFNQREIVKMLGLQQDQVRVIQTTTGGGFGGRIEGLAQCLVALATYHTRKSSRVVFTREESLLVSPKRHPYRIAVKMGATREGKLLALEMDALADAGAYTSWTPGVITKSTIHFTGPYVIANLRFKGQAVHTHKVFSAAMRGYGVPQAQFALESLMDTMAHQLGIDPWQFRYQNRMEEGAITATGQQLDESVGIGACLEAVKEIYLKHKQEAEQANIFQEGQGGMLRKGVGLACTIHGVGKTGYGNYTEAALQLNPDGTLTIYSGAADIGQGLNTVLVQIVAAELNQPAGVIDLVSSDTLLTPDGDITCASKQSYISGNAAKKAASALKQQLLQQASVLLAIPADDLELAPGAVTAKNNTGKSIGLPELAKWVKDRIVASHDVEVTKLNEQNGCGIPYETYSYGAQVIAVTVDLASAEIRADELHAAHDVGKAINPQGIEGQIYGGVVMGLGYALKENYIYGQTRGFSDYKLPKITDLPAMHSYIIEKPVSRGPFGAKGMGESTINPVAPAIANAIYHATGVRYTHLPIRLEGGLTKVNTKTDGKG